MKKRTPVFLLLILVMLIVAVSVTAITEKRGGTDTQADVPADAPVETPAEDIYSVVTQPPAPVVATAPPSTLPPVTTAAPVVTKAPAATAKPTEEPLPGYDPPETPPVTVSPTDGPLPESVALSSGSFSSNTGLGLDVKADWSARTSGEGKAEVTVSISATSYSLRCNAMTAAINVNLGGQYISLDAPAIDYNGTAAASTPLASKTFSVDLSQGESKDFNLDVVWNFGGTYGDTELPALECGGVITLTR